ncbi:MAG: PEP-CTERM sorting domain-containing protein [Desulfobacteraceae bacterium]|nr:PEP-CTERM sorting domain-containing protein [Desulfobacteraceae bacterium]MBC2750369.1 PEP-CTERM sorting domain-containing protein [Desulfobacteraceae bacterium]
MQKLLSIFLCMTVAVFLASPAMADLLLPDNPVSADDFFNPDSIVSGDAIEKAWLEGLAGEELFLLDKEEALLDGSELNLDNLNEPENMIYYILKFGNEPSHFAFMDDGDGIVNNFDFDGDSFAEETFGSKGLSHVSYYGTAPVPEPSTIVLMGLGLVGLAGLGRKKFKQ